MSDNTNIEALPELPANRMAWEYPDDTFVYSEEQMREYGLLCRRAALSNAEPVGYVGRIFVDQLTGERSAVLSNDAKTLPDMTRLFLHPSVPAPTEREKQLEEALRHIVERIDAWNKSVTKITGNAGHSWEGLEVARRLTNTGEQG